MADYNKVSLGVMGGATLVLICLAAWALTGRANPMVPAVNTDMNCPAVVGGVPDMIGSADGVTMTCFQTPTSMGPQGPQGDVGATGAAGSAGTNGTNGTNGMNAQNYGARVQTDGTGLYAWTFPTGCQHSGNIPYFNAIAEGPTPQGGVTVNPQIEGVPTSSAVSFRVTRVSATTVALLGLTILSVGSPAVTFLDLSCSPQ